MKQSFYNHIEDDGTNYALYNCRTDELVLMNPDLKRLWTAHAATDVDALCAPSTPPSTPTSARKAF